MLKKLLKPLSLVFAAGGLIFLMAGNTGAGEGYTINSSEDYKDASELLSEFVPFVNASTGFCSSGDCNAHGAAAVDAWGNDIYWTATHTDTSTDGEAHKKFVPFWGSQANINFGSVRRQSDEVFGIGFGMPAEWRLELSEGSSADDCGSSTDALTTPGRITGRTRGTEDNCDGNYTDSGAIVAAEPPWGPTTWEGQKEEWLTYPSTFYEGYAINANRIGVPNGDCRDAEIADPGGGHLVTPTDNAPAWTDVMWDCFLSEVNGGTTPAHAGASGGGVADRQQFVDQIITDYIKTGDNYAQNFQTAMTFGDSTFLGLGQDFTRTGDCETDPALCHTITDFRLEQGNTDNENTLKNAWTDSRGTLNTTQISGDKLIKNAFQLNMTTMTAPSAHPGASGDTGLQVECGKDYGDSTGGCVNADKYNWSQNIEQNMEGFFYNCINCKAINRANSFSAPRKLDMQTWTSVALPTITMINTSGDATQTAW